MKVRIALSAAFLLWMFGGASSYSRCAVAMARFSSFAISLSSIYVFGGVSLLSRISCSFFQAVLISPACLVLSVVAKIALLLKSYKTKKYCAPCVDAHGYLPGRSMKPFCFSSIFILAVQCSLVLMFGAGV